MTHSFCNTQWAAATSAVWNPIFFYLSGSKLESEFRELSAGWNENSIKTLKKWTSFRIIWWCLAISKSVSYFVRSTHKVKLIVSMALTMIISQYNIWTFFSVGGLEDKQKTKLRSPVDPEIIINIYFCFKFERSPLESSKSGVTFWLPRYSTSPRCSNVSTHPITAPNCVLHLFHLPCAAKIFYLFCTTLFVYWKMVTLQNVTPDMT